MKNNGFGRQLYEPFPEAGQFIVDCYEATNWDGKKEIRAHMSAKDVHEKIVRCGNCIHFDDKTGGCRKYVTAEDAGKEDFCPSVTELDYCSEGIMRTGDDRRWSSKICKLQSENAKLRELVNDLFVMCTSDCLDCEYGYGNGSCMLYDRIRELGVEV